MELEILMTESINADSFEEYYRFIEKVKLEEQSEEIYENLENLSNVVSVIDRNLQDYHEIIERDEFSLKIESEIKDLLEKFLFVLTFENNVDIKRLELVTFNLIEVASILSINYPNNLVRLRHIYRLNDTPKIKDVKELLDFGKSKPITIDELYKLEELHKRVAFSDMKMSSLPTQLMKEYRLMHEDTSTTHKLNLDWVAAYISEVTISMENTYKKDFINNQEILKGYSDIEDIRKLIEDLNLYETIERAFHFIDGKECAEWSMSIKFDGIKFNLANISHTLFWVSTALETIDGVKVELVSWGDGSKWLELKIRISQLASKVDVKQVLSNLVNAIDAARTNKSYSEVSKFTSEGKKLDAEAVKLLKESKNIMPEDKAMLNHELDLAKKLLDIQEKELMLEERKMDISLKKIEALKSISSLMAEGIIKNDSSIEISINDLLYLKKERLYVTDNPQTREEFANVDKIDFVNDIELIEAKETIKEISQVTTPNQLSGKDL